MIWYRCEIDKEMNGKRSSNKNTDNTSRKAKKDKFFVNFLQQILFLNYM